MPMDTNVRVLGLIVPIKNAGLQAGEDGEPSVAEVQSRTDGSDRTGRTEQ
jgi:hypothetical protein